MKALYLVSVVSITVSLSSCGGGGSESRPPSVVPPSNSAPSLDFIGDQTVVERVAEVASLTASDVDNDSLTLTIEGDDAASFVLTSTNELKFTEAPLYGAPIDQNEDNVYKITISVSDGELSDSESINVSVLLDTDKDLIADNEDSDDDNDGVADGEDAFPLDDTETEDTDEDGIGNNADPDDDNDGVIDGEDAFPLDDTESLDTDNDGVGNNSDSDDDNDGVADGEDAFPLDAGRSTAGVAASAPQIARAEYGDKPVLYVLVDFLDFKTELSDETHINRMYYENFGVADYFGRLFKGNVNIVPAKETFGTEDDGIVRVTADQNHPNNPEDLDAMFAAVSSIATQLESFIDVQSYDADNNGRLSSDELTIAFVVAGQNLCASCDHLLPEVRGFAKRPYSGAFTLSEIDVGGVSISAERGSRNDEAALNILVHELGHAIFGVSDHYGRPQGGIGETVNYLGQWCQYDRGYLQRLSDGLTGPQNMAGYTKLETNLVRAGVADNEEEVLLDSAATSQILSNREDTSLRRVWLDPYKVRESILLEYRDNLGYDSFLQSVGAIVTRTQSLAPRSSIPSDYRRAVLVAGDGQDGQQLAGESLVLEPRSDTTGYSPHPSYSRSSVNLVYGGDDSGEAQFTIRLDQYAPPSGHLRYDLYPGDEDSTLVRKFGAGYSDITGPNYSGTVYKNSTDFDTLDGAEIYARGASEITVYVYRDLLEDGIPYDLISEESFSVTEAGWHRLFFQNPISYPPQDRIFFVVGISTEGISFPLAFVRHEKEVEITASYASSTGNSFVADQRLWRQILLLSKNGS